MTIDFNEKMRKLAGGERVALAPLYYMCCLSRAWKSTGLL